MHMGPFMLSNYFGVVTLEEKVTQQKTRPMEGPKSRARGGDSTMAGDHPHCVHSRDIRSAETGERH